jgi:hypothetical protein
MLSLNHCVWNCLYCFLGLGLMYLTTLHSGGSQLIWIAPSGGRDRPDPSTGEWYPVYSLACWSCSFHFDWLTMFLTLLCAYFLSM